MRKKIHELRTKPWGYKYKIDWPSEVTLWEALRQDKASVGGFLLTLLCALIDLPDSEESGIEVAGKIETPQSKIG